MKMLSGKMQIHQGCALRWVMGESAIVHSKKTGRKNPTLQAILEHNANILAHSFLD
jgi:hypothetical protein